MQTRAIKESDWKVYRELHGVAMNRLCSRALTQVGQDTEGDSSPYEKFMRIFKTANDTNDQIARIFENPRRSTALLFIIAWRAEGLITDEKMNRFSEDIREVATARKRT